MTSEYHILLKLPDEIAALVEASPPPCVDIKFDQLDESSSLPPSCGEMATFSVGERRFRAKLMALPTVVETHKSVDRTDYIKTGHVGQMLVVAADEAGLVPSLIASSSRFQSAVLSPLTTLSSLSARRRGVAGWDYAALRADPGAQVAPQTRPRPQGGRAGAARHKNQPADRARNARNDKSEPDELWGCARWDDVSLYSLGRSRPRPAGHGGGRPQCCIPTGRRHHHTVSSVGYPYANAPVLVT